MATQPDYEEQQDDDVLDLDEAQIVDADDQQDTENENGDAGEPGFVGFSDDDAPPAPAENALIRQLRQEIRERDRRLSTFAKAAPAEPEIVVGDKPTMESCDWDADRYETERDAWDERKAAAERSQTKRQDAERVQQEQWGKVTQRYAEQKSAIRLPNRDAAEQLALEALSPTTQALVAKHADNGAQFMVALGLSPAKLAELARIDAEGDPFAVLKAVTKMEAMLQKPRTAVRPPNPDTPVRGRPIAATSGDKVLDKLEKDAERTGNRSKIIAHKAALRAKENAK